MLWMLLGLPALACSPPPLITHGFWEIFTIYSNSWIFIADQQVLSLGVWVEAEKELEACLGFLRSDSASSPPASGTFLVPQHVLLGCSELCTGTEGKEDSRSCTGQTHCFPPAGPLSRDLVACSVPTLTPSQPEMGATAWDPADTAQDT